jgi:hypothetical protein
MPKKDVIDDEVVDVALSRMEKIKEVAGNFRDAIGNNFKDMQTEVKDWRFAIENHQEGTVIDVAVKILIKRKTK